MFGKFVKIKILAAVILLAIMLGGVNLAQAGPIKDDVKTGIDNIAQYFADTAGYDANTNKNSALLLVQTVINIFLSIIGVLLLVFILYAGYHWLTAKGDEEKVKKAQDTIERAITGIIIIIAAYAISVFIMSKLEVGTLGGVVTAPTYKVTPSK